MQKEELKNKIIQFLDDNPFSDEEIEMWKGKLDGMKEGDMEELYDLLQEKIKVLTETNQLFVDMAEEIVQIEAEEAKKIPKHVNIVDMDIRGVQDIFKNDFVDFFRNNDVIKKLDEYFSLSKDNQEKVIESFDMLIKALEENQEQFVGKIGIAKWIQAYNIAHESKKRKGINRINFVSQDKNAKKLNDSERKLLLNLLKIYDYLLNPSGISFGGDGANSSVRATPLDIPKTEAEKEIDQLKNEESRYGEESLEHEVLEETIDNKERVEALKAEAEKYQEGSLERAALEEEIKKLGN